MDNGLSLADAMALKNDGYDGMNSWIWIIVLFLGCLIIYVYLYFAGLDLKDQFSSKSFINKIRSKMKYDIILLRPLVVGKTDARAFLIAVLSLLQKKNIRMKFFA